MSGQITEADISNPEQGAERANLHNRICSTGISCIPDPPFQAMSAANAGGSFTLATLMLRVACADALPSLTLTVKTFPPTLPAPGVPESPPLGETLSQPGPLTMEKVSGSSSASSALSDKVGTYGLFCVAPVSLTGLVSQLGGVLPVDPWANLGRRVVENTGRGSTPAIECDREQRPIRRLPGPCPSRHFPK